MPSIWVLASGVVVADYVQLAATGEWMTYTAIAADNGGQLVRFSWRSVPGGVITEHIDPRQEERFTILACAAHFTLAREHRIAGPGESIVVPAGVPHSKETLAPARSTPSSSFPPPSPPTSSTSPRQPCPPLANPPP